MSTARGTTPTFTLTFPEAQDLNLLSAEHVYVTFKSTGGTVILTKSDEELQIESQSIGIYLTQKETLSFYDTVLIQANWTYLDGRRAASKVSKYTFSEQLLDKEVD